MIGFKMHLREFNHKTHFTIYICVNYVFAGCWTDHLWLDFIPAYATSIRRENGPAQSYCHTFTGNASGHYKSYVVQCVPDHLDKWLWWLDYNVSCWLFNLEFSTVHLGSDRPRCTLKTNVNRSFVIFKGWVLPPCSVTRTKVRLQNDLDDWHFFV